MISAFFLVYAVGHLLLFGIALALFVRHRHVSTVPLLVVTFGLVYDNLLLGTGGMLGHGEMLARLSIPRFFMHAVATPMLMLSALGLVQRSGARWADSPATIAAVSLLVVAMIAVGFHSDMVRLALEPRQAADLISYTNAAKAGPPVAPMVTIAVLLAAGALVWRRGAGLWLLAGSGVQFAAAAAGSAIAVAGNFGELALLAGLVATDWRLSDSDGIGDYGIRPARARTGSALRAPVRHR